ncbi:MAG: undecaprenyl-diphosphate phosphatase [Chloroflexi bacterium]|nr:MAG: undecaprenyl-diphosphate phosphatase [Chloroflexota bacterium]
MNLNIWQTLFLAMLQGVTELFPISSLGHTVIIPALLGWGDLVHDPGFLPLIVALHLGTSIALFIYFWRVWFQVGRSVVKSVKDGEVKRGTEEWVSFLIIIGCIPGGLFGVFLEKPLKVLFASPLVASVFLVVNGSLLFLGERLRRRAEAKMQVENVDVKEREARFRPLSSLSWMEAIMIGFAQALALIPGISRSGVTMVAGLGVRLNHEDAARYSFLLGTPLIGAAALLEVPQLFSQSLQVLLLVLLGMVVAGVAAYLSTRFLMKYFETGRLYPFAYYCWAAGLLSLFLFLFVIPGRG